MTGRYNRKSVPLEVRGVSRDRFENHPLPEKPDGSIYQDFHNDLYGRPQTVNVLHPTISSGTPTTSYSSGSSGRSSPRSETTGSWLSSTEFDRAASRKVRALFEEIDSMLFEEKSGNKKLQAECKEWVSRFPHLRILGRQLIPPQDDGFEYLSSGDTPRLDTELRGLDARGMLVTEVTENDISLSHSYNEMTITGRHVDASHAPSQVLLSQRTRGLAGSVENVNPLEEEIFAQDGVIEDIIAVDYKTTEDDIRSSSSNKWGAASSRWGKRKDMPPVTPQACVKNNISGATFDFIWQETISWLRNVLENYSERIVPELEDSYDTGVGGVGGRGQQVAKLPYALPGVGGGLAGLGGLGSPRGVDPASRESTMMVTSRVGGGGPVGGINKLAAPHPGLNSLLTISVKAMFPREKSNMIEDGVFPLSSMNTTGRPSSQLQKYSSIQRPISVSRDRQLNSATVRRTTRRLAPIPVDRAKTPSTEEPVQLHNQILRGKALSVMAEQPSSSSPAHLHPQHSAASPPPPIQYPRNGALPPIPLSSQDNSETPAAPAASMGSVAIPSMAAKKKAHFSMHRASSAVGHEKEPRLQAFKEKTVLPIETRPSTTHAIYRSETPGFGGLGINRRSSTPMGISSRGPLGGSVGGAGGLGGGGVNPMQMSITGNSINPGHDPVHGISELDDPAATASASDHFDVHTTHWGSPNHLNPQMRRPKQQANMQVR